MFDIGFFELLVVATVGLLVIGPERLPSAVRSTSLWIGRIKRSIRDTRSEFERQIGADDIRRQLHNEEIMRALGEAPEQVERTLNEQTFTSAPETSSAEADDHLNKEQKP